MGEKSGRGHNNYYRDERDGELDEKELKRWKSLKSDKLIRSN